MTVNSFNTSLSAGKALANFTANTTNGNTVAFTMSTLTKDKRYLVNVNGSNLYSPIADTDGVIRFSHSSWPAGVFTVVEDASYVPTQLRGNATGKSIYVNQAPLRAANVTLHYMNGTSYGQSVLSGSDGSFEFKNVSYGSYYVVVDKQLYIQNTSSVFNINSGSIDIGSIKLMFCDLNGDNNMNVLDVNMIAQRCSEITGTSYPLVDVNGDGIVDIDDVSLAVGQIGIWQ